MAYELKTTNEFKKELDIYLEKYPLELDYEETLITNFSSSNLSDLYKLFLDLKNTELTENLYIMLRDILQNSFHINPDTVLPLDEENIYQKLISGSNIHSLENIIKDAYSNYLSTSEDIDKNELYRLSVIVNKIFPEFFLDLITSKPSGIEEQQVYVKDKLLSTINHWSSHNSKKAEEEHRDIAAALYITAQKLYPDLSIYIPGRIKSMKSSITNINKELLKNISNILPSDFSTGISNEDLEKQFSLENANTDFSGLTIVLANTDDILHFDESSPKSPELLQLRKMRFNNLTFIHSLENFLSQNDENYFSDSELLQIKIDLLTRLRECSYPECRQEFQGTSFNKLLKEAINNYHYAIESSTAKPISFDEAKYFLELDEIETLLEELKKRVHDKYQAKILDIVIPEILQDEIFSETLKLKSRFVKTVKKENGFYSSYYQLITASDRKIELQVQPKMRFKDSKDGSSDHSRLPNKTIDISNFFEPANIDCDESQYESSLSLLNNTPLAIRTVLNQTADDQLTPREKRLKKKLKIAEQNVKLKDYIEFGTTADGRIKKSPIETYLPIFAEYVSPKLMSISSHHTRFHKSIAAHSKKSLVSCFREVLLKKDSTSCLAQQLIDKLEDILPDDKNEISLNGIHKRAYSRQQENSASTSLEH